MTYSGIKVTTLLFLGLFSCSSFSEEEIAEGFALLCVGRALTPDLKLSLE